MTTVAKELLELERHARAVLEAMPALRDADENLKGFEKLNALKRIGEEYGLSLQ